MHEIHVEKETLLPPGGAIARLEAELLKVPNLKMFVETCERRGDSLHIDGNRGVKGVVRAGEGRLVVDLQIAGMSGMMLRMIENRLSDALDRILAD